MSHKTDVWQGTLTLMILKTLETMGALHGYGIARRIEQTSGDQLNIDCLCCARRDTLRLARFVDPQDAPPHQTDARLRNF